MVEAQRPDGQSNSPPDATLYDLSAVTYELAAKKILEPLTVSLSAAQVYAIIGANGSGKSSLIKLLARQRAPTAGRISFRGRELASYTQRELARSIAYLPQFTPPTEGVTVRELASLGRFPWHGAFGRFGDDDRAHVDAALQRMDLIRLEDRLVDQLSGGERQRAWLAMMLAQNPACLLLDEPTSALDIAHQSDLLHAVREISRAEGLSVLIVIHDINMAARYCDDILAMRDGRLITRGSPKQILEPGVLEELYGLRMGVLPHPVTGEPMSYVL